MADNIYDIINSKYDKTGYFTRYAGDLLITAIICSVVFIIVSYYHVINSIQPIKSDWANQRCNPSVIPFAGIINKPSDQTTLEFTSSNFINCTQATLEDVASYALMPLYYSMSVITDLMQTLADSLNSLRSTLSTIRGNFSSMSSELYGRILNILIPIIHIFQKVQSMFGKIQASATSAIYTLYGSYITLNSTFLFIYDTVITIMWAMVGIIIGCFAIGWLIPPMLATGLSLSAFLSILLIPAVVMIVIMQDIFSASGMKSAPSVPHYCFSGDTKLTLLDGKTIKIKDAKPNQILYDGSKITAIMRSDSSGMKMYKLNNIIVSSKHFVYNRKLGWINAEKHPESIVVDDFREKYVYCIGTSTKIIKIDNMLFSDWDEIDDQDINEIKNSQYGRNYLPNNFTKNDIHKYLDSGLHPDTKLCLYNGENISIKDIEINNVLKNGEIVKTVVEITCDDIDNFYNFYYKDKLILKGTSNLIINNYNKSDKDIIKIKSEPSKYAYHIVTDKGYFKINDDYIVQDYNKIIDRFLSDNNLQNSYNY